MPGGVSTRQVDDISKLLWGDRMPSQTLSDKLKRVYDDIDRWRTGHWNPNTRTCSWTACGTSAPGAEAWRTSASSSPSASTRRATREVIGVTEGMREDAASVYGQINVYGVTTKSEWHKRSYWTRSADGNGIGGRKAPVPYGS